MADAPISGAVAKADNVLVKGSYSLAIALGVVRCVKPRRPVTIPLRRRELRGRASTSSAGTLRVTIGAIVTASWPVTWWLPGDRGFEGQTLLLDYKNEHLVADIDGRIVATCPDLITMVDRQTAEGRQQSGLL